MSDSLYLPIEANFAVESKAITPNCPICVCCVKSTHDYDFAKPGDPKSRTFDARDFATADPRRGIWSMFFRYAYLDVYKRYQHTPQLIGGASEGEILAVSQITFQDDQGDFLYGFRTELQYVNSSSGGILNDPIIGTMTAGTDSDRDAVIIRPFSMGLHLYYDGVDLWVGDNAISLPQNFSLISFNAHSHNLQQRFSLSSSLFYSETDAALVGDELAIQIPIDGEVNAKILSFSSQFGGHLSLRVRHDSSVGIGPLHVNYVYSEGPIYYKKRLATLDEMQQPAGDKVTYQIPVPKDLGSGGHIEIEGGGGNESVHNLLISDFMFTINASTPFLPYTGVTNNNQKLMMATKLDTVDLDKLDRVSIAVETNSLHGFNCHHVAAVKGNGTKNTVCRYRVNKYSACARPASSVVGSSAYFTPGLYDPSLQTTENRTLVSSSGDSFSAGLTAVFGHYNEDGTLVNAPTAGGDMLSTFTMEFVRGDDKVFVPRVTLSNVFLYEIALDGVTRIPKSTPRGRLQLEWPEIDLSDFTNCGAIAMTLSLADAVIVDQLRVDEFFIPLPTEFTFVIS